ARLEVGHYEVPQEDLENEVARFDEGLRRARDELGALKAHIAPDAPPELEAFLNLHRMILDDSALSRAPRERKADVQQAVERVLKALMGGHVLPEPALSQEQRLIVVAHDLSPADMILFKRHHFGGFVTDVGGVTSHTAIVARSLGIPAIVGLHHAFQTISERELLIVDGVHGVLIVNPDPLVLEEYKSLQSQLGLERKRLKLLKSTPAATLDGTPIELYAN